MQTAEITLGTIGDSFDPYPLYQRLRDERPVALDAESGTYLVTRFDDVYAILRDHQHFSNVPAEVLADPSRRLSPIREQDPPEHGRMRRLVTPMFTPGAMKAMQPRLDDAVARLVGQIQDDGVVECSAAFAIPLPGRVTLDLLGLPVGSHRRFSELTAERLGLIHLPEDAGRTIVDVRRDLWDIVGPVVEERRRAPAPDVVSLLVRAQDEAGEELLDDDTLLDMLLHVLTGGFETTQHLIELLLDYLADHPESWVRLRADRALIDGAVDEMLRWESPVQWLYRRTTSDCEVAGEVIPEGAKVAVVYGSANRDGRQFPDPDEYMLDRDLKRHLAFSHGIHYCVGAPLTRYEVRTLLNHLLDRYSGIERAGPSEPWTDIGAFRGLTRVPVRFRREASASPSG